MDMDHSLVTIEQDIPLADSREVANQLGIDHESFYSQIKRYQKEIEEDFGIIRLKIGVKLGPQRGKLPRYALLTEEQTYAYMSYSQNTEKARRCKRLLVKAFTEAKERLKEAQSQQQQASAPTINSLWEQRLETFNRENKIPEGYWCIFGFVAGNCFMDEFRDVHLIEEALPDGSIGKRWCTYLRERGFDMRLVKKYPHRYPDQRGIQHANIYPNAWLGEFWTWFHGVYLKEHYPVYLQTHRRQLPDPKHLTFLPPVD
jgi:phage regulator Rha-like protein